MDDCNPWPDDVTGNWDTVDAPPHTDAEVPWDWEADWDLPAPATYTPSLTVVPDRPSGDDDEEHTSWWPVDLAQLFDGNYQPPVPTMFARTDGQPILYPGKAHAFNGAPESGKSWAALVAVVQTVNAGHNALYLDFEDSAPTVVTRLLALGADPARILAHLTYISPADPLMWHGKYTPAGLEFDQTMNARDYALAIIDGVTEAMGLHGLDINSNNDVAAFYNMLPRRLQARGAATAQIDHIPKNREGGTKGGIGGQHKLAGLDVSFLFEVTSPFGLGQHGTAKVVIEKDRPGQLRQHAIGTKHEKLAEFHLISDPDTHNLTAELRPMETPSHPGQETGFRPTHLMEKVSAFIGDCNANENYPSQRMIEDGVKGKGEFIRQALAELVREGYVQKGGNGRRITEHTSLKVYVEEL